MTRTFTRKPFVQSTGRFEISYLIESIKSQEGRTTKQGKPFTKYMLSLKDEGDVPFADFQGLVPQPGQTLEGYEIENHPQFGRELKKAGSSNGAKPKFGRSPAETKAIQRQHSQEMGLRWMAIQVSRGKVPEEFGYEQLKPIIDWFENDIG